MRSEKILVVEDEENLREAVRYTLSGEGYEVYVALDGEIALEQARKHLPDLVILDVMLPSLDGFEVCRILRKEFDMPIFLLTAKTEEIDKVVGLEIGADDYITKPFSMRELLARTRNALRRYSATKRTGNTKDSKANLIDVGNLIIDASSRKVFLSGVEVSMKPREFTLLHFLASHRYRAFTRLQLLEDLWEHDYIGDIRTVDVHIRWIRKKIEDDPQKPTKITTIRGIGYRFDG